MVVAPRAKEDKAHELPALRTVPQTLAAGWSGSTSVMPSLADLALTISGAAASISCSECTDMDFSIRAVLHASAAASPRRLLPADLPEPIDRLIGLIDADPSRAKQAPRGLLSEAGVASEFDEVFRHAASVGLNVDMLTAIVLARLRDGEVREWLAGSGAHASAESAGVRRGAMIENYASS